MTAGVAGELRKQVVNDAADTAAAESARAGKELRIQGNTHVGRGVYPLRDMMEGPQVWLPRRSRGGEATAWVAIGVGVAAAACLGVGLGSQPGLGMLAALVATAVLGAAAAALALWAAGYRGLRYVLGDEGLCIDWLGAAVEVPFAAIESVLSGQRLAESSAPRMPSWPGIYVGPGRARGIGTLRFFATTRDTTDLTVVAVRLGGVVVSPEDPKGFRAALIERVRQHEHEPVPEVGILSRPPTEKPWTALRDRWALACGAVGLLLLFVMLAILEARSPGLPDRLPLRFDATGRPTDVGLKGELFRLPLGGLVALLVSAGIGVWLHARDVGLARMLWVVGAIVQAILLVAVVRLLQ